MLPSRFNDSAAILDAWKNRGVKTEDGD
ncbi:hypothetical protein A2U01_0075430, partial [Trifolium medium]|nr:hypothetical protein [Trifolium medium]